MKLKSIPILALLLCAQPQFATAFHNDGGYYILWGMGGLSCGEWVEARKNTDSPDALFFQTWLDGYVSAAVWYGQPIEKIDSSPFYVWMDNYCQKNPLVQMSNGAKGLVKELVERHKKQ